MIGVEFSLSLLAKRMIRLSLFVLLMSASVESAQGSARSMDHQEPLSFDPTRLDRCTTMIVGKKAGKDGPMTTHTADCLDCDFRANKVPAADHPKGSTRNCYLYKGDYPQSLMEDRGATWKKQNLEGTEEQKRAWGDQSEVVMTIPEVRDRSSMLVFSLFPACALVFILYCMAQ